ncbi:prolyl oligopeptidase family serine peptidase [Marivirga sp. S37H4]|uniref:Prolyl oligopeptidase family serine peptidase n=1 Tax=Marivirga aurantiaca TaxID=2802615 RepID=A0A934WW21_9BACT|nr:prolyl oligopeptidase family serine peptidase [Marivirga aurantiaca]MBK6264019.1 prolyl oligopeptidase family serine peptidase [Marivirga aurantiaca]
MTHFKFSSLLLIFFCTISCNSPKAPESIRNTFGEFNGSNILLHSVDYQNAPIAKRIKHHPENYTYLDQVEIHSMAYNSDSLMISGFMVQPKKPGKYPVIIFNRGGNQELGRLLIASAVEIMAPFAAEGFVVVASNYRGNSGSEGKEEFGGADVNDILNLIKHLGEIPKADTANIALLGISRGGMMNYLTLKKYQGSNIKAVASIGGVSDLGVTMQYHPEIEEVCKELIPDFNQQREESIIQRSANYWPQLLPKIPYLIFHSKTDKHVHFSQAEILADSLKKHHYSVDFHLFEDDTHGLTANREYVTTTILNAFSEATETKNNSL